MALPRRKYFYANIETIFLKSQSLNFHYPKRERVHGEERSFNPFMTTTPATNGNHRLCVKRNHK